MASGLDINEPQSPDAAPSASCLDLILYFLADKPIWNRCQRVIRATPMELVLFFTTYPFSNLLKVQGADEFG